MAIHTKIQWSDSTINPVMGCGEGCELWPSLSVLADAIIGCLDGSIERTHIRTALAGMTASDVYHYAERIAEDFGRSPTKRKEIIRAIRSQFRCYAGILHIRHGTNPLNSEKYLNGGYARTFEHPELFPGRVASASKYSDLRGTNRPDKPWMNGQRRMIFISDMGDSIGSKIPFEYLTQEVIDVVRSESGQRHLWQWLTKRPYRMFEFAGWLAGRSIEWPENLIAMTSVTSEKTVRRAVPLAGVPALYRGLSVEPLRSPVKLVLSGIDWVIVGGESGPYAHPFEVEWAESVIAQCRAKGVAVFVKQLGSKVRFRGQPLKLRDSHGGDWSEWPDHLRIREFPSDWLLRS